MTHICVSKLTITGSCNGLAHIRHQAIIWINAGILLNGPLWTKFNEILIEIDIFSLKKYISECRLGNGCHFVPATMSYRKALIFVRLFHGKLLNLWRMTQCLEQYAVWNNYTVLMCCAFFGYIDIFRIHGWYCETARPLLVLVGCLRYRVLSSCHTGVACVAENVDIWSWNLTMN